ncbi:MAG: hypothetical protein HY759_00070 [Nitrospirae bacterium]|nr:hypothetical protein [Nitrospirota bacterium]
MRLYALVFLIFILLCSGVTASGKMQDADAEEEEIIKILDMLKDYDLLINMDVYESTDKMNDDHNTVPDIEEKDKKGKQ